MESRGTNWVNVFLPVTLIAGLVLLLGVGGPTEGEPAAMQTPLEPWLELGVGYLAVAAEGTAAIVIGVAVLRAFVAFARGLGGHALSPEEIRLPLGRMRAVVLPRTLLNHFLAAEIREQEKCAAG